MNPENVRLVNVAVAFLIAVTLTARAWTSWRTWPRDRRWDFAFRAASQVGVFCGTIYASYLAWSDSQVPMRGYVYVVTSLLTAYLVSLWTPWRWRLHRRQPIHSPSLPPSWCRAFRSAQEAP